MWKCVFQKAIIPCLHTCFIAELHAYRRLLLGIIPITLLNLFEWDRLACGPQRHTSDQCGREVWRKNYHDLWPLSLLFTTRVKRSQIEGNFLLASPISREEIIDSCKCNYVKERKKERERARVLKSYPCVRSVSSAKPKEPIKQVWQFTGEKHCRTNRLCVWCWHNCHDALSVCKKGRTKG